MGDSESMDHRPTGSSAGSIDESEAVGVVNRLLMEGNLPLANYLVRQFLESRPESPALNYLLASIVGAVGRIEEAKRLLREVLAIAPGFDSARDELLLLEQETPAAARSSAKGDRYLLIRAWGFGFWSDVSHVLGQLLLAEITDRVPVIHWGAGSRFSDGRGEAFRHFFRPVSQAVIDDLPASELEYFPPKWTRDAAVGPDRSKFDGEWSRMDAIYFLERPEAVLVSDFFTPVAGMLPWIPSTHQDHGRRPVDIMRRLAASYLRPIPELQHRVDTFVESRLADRRWIAVHLRGSDKSLESADLDLVNDEIMDEADLAIVGETDARVLLISDDERLVERARVRWGERVLTTDVCRTSSDQGVHYLAGLDPIALGREVLMDAMIAVRCGRFIGNGQSNVSAMIECLREWPEQACRMIRPSMFSRVDTFLHQPRLWNRGKSE